jgi:hypothetical protein
MSPLKTMLDSSRIRETKSNIRLSGLNLLVDGNNRASSSDFRSTMLAHEYNLARRVLMLRTRTEFPRRSE